MEHLLSGGWLCGCASQSYRMGCGASSAAVGMEGGSKSLVSLGSDTVLRSANDATVGVTANNDPTSTSGRRLSNSRKTPQMSQFLDKTVAAEWRANHTVSIRANLVQTKKSPITDDFIFDLEKEIGRGGVGAVVVGESKKEKGALYAIKVCDKSAVSVSRLTREVLLLKDVAQLYIVRLFTVYDLPTHMYFVMELCRGGHLGVLLKSKPQERLDEVWARRLCWQLMSAVAHLHERGICHRDVKLQNVLLDTYDVDKAQIKLIDFGYGSRFIGALPMRSKVGTPYTMAPEVLRESYDQRCDVWSVGVVLYIMLSGRRPFEPLDCVGHLTEAGKATMTTNVLSGRYRFDFPSFRDVSDEAKQFVDLLFTQPYMSRLEATEALNEPWLREQRPSLSLSASLAQDSLSNNVVANMLSNLDADAPSLRRTGNVAVVFGLQPSEACRMRGVFQTVDTDGSGGLDLGEFTTAMQILCPSLSAADCGIVFKAVDINGDGQISYTEFLGATPPLPSPPSPSLFVASSLSPTHSRPSPTQRPISTPPRLPLVSRLSGSPLRGHRGAQQGLSPARRQRRWAHLRARAAGPVPPEAQPVPPHPWPGARAGAGAGAGRWRCCSCRGGRGKGNN